MNTCLFRMLVEDRAKRLQVFIRESSLDNRLIQSGVDGVRREMKPCLQRALNRDGAVAEFLIVKHLGKIAVLVVAEDLCDLGDLLRRNLVALVADVADRSLKARCVDQQHLAPPILRFARGKNPQVGDNRRVVEKFSRHLNNGLHKVFFKKPTTDFAGT